MRNVDLFLQRYNKLDALLRERTGLGAEIPYAQVVERAAQKDAAVRRRKERLLAIGRLRNAIIHHREYPEQILADPRVETIKDLESLLAEIENPVKVIPKYRREVKVFSDQHFLIESLSYMKNNDFSQIVVLVEHQHTILSTEGIAKWLENAREVGLADLERALIADALEYEDQSICRYMSRSEPVDAAYEMFEKAIAKGIPRLQAVLITHNGQPHERPLGIITPWDLLGEPQ